MENDRATTLTLQHLSDASRLLLLDAPLTSAHLNRTASAIIEEEWPQRRPTALDRDVCPSCGTIAVSGWTTTIDTGRETRKGRRRTAQGKATSSQAQEKQRSVRYTCNICSRSRSFAIGTVPKSRVHTRFAQPPASTATVSPGKVSSPSNDAISQQAQPATSSGSTNAKSKQRAKARKSGLRDMLEKSKEKKQADTGAFGFDLGDFMKPG